MPNETDRIHNYEPLWGEWHVDALIGAGSFGKVYRVSRTIFGKTYYSAVKIISIPQDESEVKHSYSEGMDEQSVRTYFESIASSLFEEIRLMSSVKGNTHIVGIEDYKIVERTDTIGWDILIRMELVESLVDHLASATLSRKDVIKLGADICRALELCQRVNIVHRDVKPENIFISPLGEYKLGDFGIARQVEKTISVLSKKGTSTYMAPEVYRDQAYDSTVDIYSLGLVLYRLLNNNRTPFLPSYPSQITYSLRESALSRRMLGELLPRPVNADGRLAEIVLRACAYQSSDRYENPRLMREALEAIQYQADEAPLIYPKGDTVENKSFEYVSDSLETPEKTASILAEANAKSMENTTESVQIIKVAAIEGPKIAEDMTPLAPHAAELAPKRRSMRLAASIAAAVVVISAIFLSVNSASIFSLLKPVPSATASPAPIITDVATPPPTTTLPPSATPIPSPTSSPSHTPIPTSKPTPTRVVTKTPTPTPSILNAKVGNIVYFGTYEQDNITSNDKEPIAWRVLALDHGKVLLVSDKNLDCKPYNLNNSFGSITWADCTLRTWLNVEFLASAFSATQASRIATTTVINSNNPVYNTSGGVSTNDRIFLLSNSEASGYFSSDSARIGRNTAYAKFQGAFDSDGIGYWLLRTPGPFTYDSTCVDPSGVVLSAGHNAGFSDFSIRPAMWVSQAP
jgi:serine/threonine protein kinase